MSYARFSKFSDVYVFPHINGYVTCCGCSLGGDAFYSAADLVAHLREHVDVGHKVPAILLDESTYDPDDFTASVHAGRGA